MPNTTYLTIDIQNEGLYKEKGSKFYSFIYPIISIEEAKSRLKTLKLLHPKASHYCYAYRIGQSVPIFEKSSDDGEPNGTAGLPILNQLKSFELTNCLIVIVRYFGGTKLGVSGLISAYKTSTSLIISSSELISRQLYATYSLQTNYKHIGLAYSLINKFNASILHQSLENICKFEITLNIEQSDKIEEYAQNQPNLKLILEKK